MIKRTLLLAVVLLVGLGVGQSQAFIGGFGSMVEGDSWSITGFQWAGNSDLMKDEFGHYLDWNFDLIRFDWVSGSQFESPGLRNLAWGLAN